MHPFSLLQSVVRPHTLRDWKLHGLDWLIDVAVDVAGVLLGAVVAWLVIRLIAQSDRALGRGRADGPAQRARAACPHVRQAVPARRSRDTRRRHRSCWCWGSSDFNISPLLASAGVVGLAVSFGSQSLVRDFVTGFFLQLEHQFALGDVIRIGTVEGTVENITLRLVYLRDATGALHIIPNGQITQVTNLTRAWGRVAIDVDVAWRDADRAEQAVIERGRSARRMIPPGPTRCWIRRGSPESRSSPAAPVTLRTIARVDPYRRDDVARDLRQRIKLALDRAGIVTFVPPALPIA